MLPPNDWRVEFFTRLNGHTPVQEYMQKLEEKYQAKIIAHIELLRSKAGRLYAPYAKHIQGPIWELRVDLGRLASRIFYFLASEQKIVLLHAFAKKSQKTPAQEIITALRYYDEYAQIK